MTDGIGECEIRVRVVDSGSLLEESGQDDIYNDTILVRFADPFATVEGVFGLELQFPEPGAYHVELCCEEEILMARRFIISAPEQKDHNDD